MIVKKSSLSGGEFVWKVFLTQNYALRYSSFSGGKRSMNKKTVQQKRCPFHTVAELEVSETGPPKDR